MMTIQCVSKSRDFCVQRSECSPGVALRRLQRLNENPDFTQQRSRSFTSIWNSPTSENVHTCKKRAYLDIKKWLENSLPFFFWYCFSPACENAKGKLALLCTHFMVAKQEAMPPIPLPFCHPNLDKFVVNNVENKHNLKCLRQSVTVHWQKAKHRPTGRKNTKNTAWPHTFASLATSLAQLRSLNTRKSDPRVKIPGNLPARRRKFLIVF